MSEPFLVAVMVTHDRLAKLQRSIRAYAMEKVDILLVVDNASKDGTAEWLENQRFLDPRIRVLRLDTNQGGAGGFEAGLRWADERMGGKGWVVLHDDDAYPAPGAIETFLRKQAQRSFECFCGVAASVLDTDGKAVEVNRPILNLFRHPCYTLSRTLGSSQSIRDLYHVPRRDVEQPGRCYPIHAASFVGLFVNLDRLPESPQCRHPNRDLFLYGDDTLYTARLHRSGCPLYFDSDLRFIHDTLTGYERGIVLPPWKNFYIARNTLLVYQALSPWMGWLLYGIGICSRLLTLANYNDPQERRRVRRAIFLGVADAMRGHFTRTLESVLDWIDRCAV